MTNRLVYISGTGWLFRLDPRTKLWITFLSVITALFIRQVSVLAGLLVTLHLLFLAGGIRLDQIGRAWRGLLILLIFVTIGQILITDAGTVLFTFVGLPFTDIGFQLAGRYALRLLNVAFAVLMLVVTTSPPILVRGLQKLGLPYNWGMMVGLALHYMETLSELYRSIREAQQARGLDLESGGLRTRVQMAVPTVVAVIISSLRLGDSLALGLAARGFGLPHQRTVWQDIHMRRVDWLTISLSSIFIVSTIIISLKS